MASVARVSCCGSTSLPSRYRSAAAAEHCSSSSSSMSSRTTSSSSLTVQQSWPEQTVVTMQGRTYMPSRLLQGMAAYCTIHQSSCHTSINAPRSHRQAPLHVPVMQPNGQPIPCHESCIRSSCTPLVHTSQMVSDTHKIALRSRTHPKPAADPCKAVM
jgi:hypothetical protein